MDRRTVLAGFVTAAFATPVLAQQGTPPAVAQPRNTSGQGPTAQTVEDELRHIRETLALGAVTLETSRLALMNARDNEVKQFAQFEIEEQLTLSEVLRSLLGESKPVADLDVGSTASAPANSTAGAVSTGNAVAPPGSSAAVAVPESGSNAEKALDSRGQEIVDNLKRSQGAPGFDRAYLNVQLQGHRDLLRAQERYLQASPRTRELPNVVKIFRGQIREHIAVLEVLQRKAP
jgi:putative membrane protein